MILPNMRAHRPTPRNPNRYVMVDLWFDDDVKHFVYYSCVLQTVHGAYVSVSDVFVEPGSVFDLMHVQGGFTPSVVVMSDGEVYEVVKSYDDGYVKLSLVNFTETRVVASCIVHEEVD